MASIIEISRIPLISTSKLKSERELGNYASLEMVWVTDNGWCFIATFSGNGKCGQHVIQTARRGIKFIKCPEKAHTFAKKINNNCYSVRSGSWSSNEFYDPHKASHTSRLRSQTAA